MGWSCRAPGPVTCIPSARDRGALAYLVDGGAPMNPNPASSISESAKGRAARSNKLSLRALVQNLIVRVRLWLDKLLSFPYARVVMVFVVGFAAGVVWHSYGSVVR